jgi:hypothetical protein
MKVFNAPLILNKLCGKFRADVRHRLHAAGLPMGKLRLAVLEKEQYFLQSETA